MLCQPELTNTIHKSEFGNFTFKTVNGTVKVLDNEILGERHMLSDNVGLWQYCRTDHCDIEDSDSQPWLHAEIF